MRKKVRKRIHGIASWTFSLALVFSMTPVSAFAAPDDGITMDDAVAEQLVDEPADVAGDEAAPMADEGPDASAEAGQPDATAEDAADGAAGQQTEPRTVEAADEATADEAPQADDETDDAASADFAEKDGTEAADVQGEATEDEDVAVEVLADLDGVDAAKAEEVAGELVEPEGFSPMADDDDDPDGNGVPRQGDGSFIEGIKAKWITADTIDNDDPELLYIKPSGDNEQSVRLQINYALSGEHAYEPGDITITVPAHIFKKRGSDTADYGALIIPYPEDPSTRNDFNYKLIGDTYVITNTKRMSAATKGYIQFSIEGLTPHELVDMDISEPFDAFIEVVTHKGNTIDLRSNELTAQFDTDAQVTSASKQAYGAVERVQASQIPEAQRALYPDETEFIKVNWYAWYKADANTLYKVDILDLIDQDATVITEDGVARPESEFHGFIIGATSEDGTQLSGNIVNSSYRNGQSSYYYYSTAYPASQFEKDTKYTFHNQITYTLTELDDPNRVTNRTANAQTTWSFRDPIWSDPSGHFMVVKNGNDDKEQNGHDKYNYTHHKNYGASSYTDTHLWNRSSASGWYGIYPTALNDLLKAHEASGEDGSVRVSYTVDTVGYVMPWMYDDSNPEYDDEGNLISSRMSKNYTRPVTMTTSDLGPSIGRGGAKLAVGEDYEYISVEFPADPYVYYGKPQNINPDGSWVALDAGDGTFLYTMDSDKAHWPDITLEAQVGGTWQTLGTASWKSGSFAFTPAGEGATAQSSRVVDLPEGTENFRTTVTCQNTSTDEEANLALQAALNYDMRVNVELKSTDELVAMIEDAFEASNAPDLAVWNEARMVPSDAEGETITTIDNDGYDSLRGYTTAVSVYPYKTAKQTVRDVDYDKRTVTVHYTAKVEERSVINDKSTYEQAVQDNPNMAETHGVWRDLLPKGVTPDLSTITLSPATDAWDDSNYVRRTGDRVVDAYTIENYEGTGRTMLVVEVALTPTPQRYRSGDMYYYEDVPRIAFDAELGFEALRDYYSEDNRIHNVISFESSNDEMGTVDHYKGEPDDPDGGNNVSSPDAFATDAEKTAMTDLNPDRDTPSFVYAGRYTRIDILSAARTSLTKDVQVNNDGWWSDGLYYGEKEENQRIVYEGGQYSYRLRMMSDDETISKDLILYDSLENFQAGDGNDTIDIPAPHWRGTLVGVDTSQLEDMGCKPVIYYSEVPDLQLSDESDPDVGNPVNMDLANSDIWTEADAYAAAHGGDLSGVTAVAVDAGKKADGTDFELQPLESVVVIINMRAPSGDEAREALSDDAKGIWGDSAQAYNNAYLLCTSIDSESLEEDSDNFVHKDYTKVGLMEYGIEAIKAWSDGGDRDGIRPDGVTLHLYADGEDTGKTVELPIIDPDTGAESWTASFEHIPYTNPSGDKIHYTIKEDDMAAGYEVSVQPNGDSSFTITNIHEPERISVAGTKSWMGDEGNPDARPSSITVKLYSNGRFVQSKTVRPDADGDWEYTFDNLYKYENGEEIVYTVQEDASGPAASYVPIVADDVNIINIYHPFGDLAVSKTVENTTATSAEVEFPFTFAFFAGEGDDADPVTDDFEYEILDAEGNPVLDEGGDPLTGTLTRDNRTVSIKGGQTIHVKDIPEYVRYTVTEEQQPGFEQTGASGASGTIKPNATQQARFTNEYSARSQINLTATKTLHDRELQRSQFRFELWQVADDGTETLVRTAANARPDGEPATLDDGTIASSASVTFGALHYTQDDAAAQQESGNPYRYIIKEVDTDKAGYVYDDAIYHVTVSVVDNNDGTLTVTPTYLDAHGDAGDPPVFENYYEASGELVLRAWKDLQGRALEADKFEFQLFDEEGNLIDAKKNTADGSVVFDALHFDQTDIGKTYNYSVREVAGTDPAVNYDGSEFGYTVEVLDNGDGTLSFNQGFATPIYSQAEACSICHNHDGKGETIFHDAGIHPETFDVRNYHIAMLEANGIPRSQLFNYPDLSYSGNDSRIREDMERYMRFILHVDDIPDGVTYYLSFVTDQYGDPDYTLGYYCPECHGDGIGMCPECDGTGKIDGEDCPSCLGTGLAREITGWDTDEGELPVFVNTLKPGLLAVEKHVTDAESADPEQEFTFKVKLIGEGIEDGERDYTVSAADGQASFGPASDDAAEPVPAAPMADETAEPAEAEGYAPLAEGDATIIASGSGANNVWGIDWKITSDGEMILGNGGYQEFDTTGHPYSPASAPGAVYPPWYNYMNRVKSIRIDGQVKASGSFQMMFNGNDFTRLETVDFTGMDFGGVTNMNYMLAANSSLKKVTFGATGTASGATAWYLFYGCSALTELDLSQFNSSNLTTSGMQQWFYLVNTYPSGKLQTVHLGPDFRFKGTALNTPPTNETYTGQWIRTDGVYGPFTPAQLQSNYTTAMTGTWVWQERPVEYTVTFTAEDGTAGSMAPAKMSVKTASALPANKFVKYGYDFDHWTVVEKNGTAVENGKQYANRATVDASEDGYAENDAITLMASFVPRDTTVTITDGEFEFTLRGGEKATFDDLPAGTAYQVWEETPDGWVLVQQSNASGTIEPLETALASFTNRYQPGIATAQFAGVKTLDNQAAEAGAFTFELNETTEGASGKATMMIDGQEQEVDLPYTVSTTEGGFVQFPVIVYGVEDIGTHTYTITEVNQNDGAIDYDAHAETVTVEVSGDVGRLAATTTIDADGDGKIAFANMTRPGELRIAKSASPITDANKDDVFTFKVTLSNEKGLPLGSGDAISWYVLDEDGNVVVTESSDAGADAPDPDEGTTPFGSPLGGGAGEDAAVEAAGAAGGEGQPAQAGQANLAADGGFGLLAEDDIASGTSGSCVWVIDRDGVLTISPAEGDEGTLGDWNFYGRVPWASYRDSITAARFAGTIHAGNSCEGFFYGCYNLTDVDFTGFDTSTTTDMSYMFNGCSSLETLDLSALDTSNVEDMAYMFQMCGNLKGTWDGDLGYVLDLGSFDTSKVTRMTFMFQGASSLEYIQLNKYNSDDGEWTSSFDTSNVTSMQGMFEDCNSLTFVDVSGFNTGKVGSMASMFKECHELTSVDVSGFTSDAGRVGVYEMFQNCHLLTSIDLGKLETDATNYNNMFAGCTNLEVLDIRGINTKTNNTTSGGMFGQWNAGNQCTKLKQITFGPGFQFKTPWFPRNPNNDTLYLPTPSSNSPYTGKWIRADETYGPWTASQVKSYWGDDTAGTWIWQVDDTRGVVSFDANGGYTSAPLSTYTSATARVYLPDDDTTTRPKYELVGWNTKADGTGTGYPPGSSATDIVQMGHSVVLYAQWERAAINTCTVHHYQQNVALDDYVLADTEVIEGEAGTEVTPSVRTYTGFTSPEAQTVTIAADNSTVVDYYYDRETFVVHFEGNGATSGAMSDQKIPHGESVALQSNGFKKTGAIFTGWNTEADGSGNAYTDGLRPMTDADAEDGVVTLYAQWLENPNEELTPENGVVYVTCRAGETIVIPDLPAGTTYTVEEVDLPGGWTNTDSSGTNGTIVANATSDASFTNSYQASGELYLAAHKKLVGADLGEGEFNFVAYMVAGQDDPSGERIVLAEASNGVLDTSETIYDDEDAEVDNPWVGTAPVSFGPITRFTESDVGQTFTIYIEEIQGDDPAIAYDEHAELAQVTVTDAGNGELAFDVVYADGKEPLFTNTVEPCDLVVSKSVEGAGTSNTIFEFTLELKDARGDQLAGSYPVKLKDGDSDWGPADMATIGSGETFTLKDGQSLKVEGLPGGATYTVTEVEKEGWELVSSEGDEGTLAAGSTSEAAFVNKNFGDEPDEPGPHEFPPASVSLSLTADKTMTGRAIGADEFYFELVDEATGDVEQTVSTSSFGGDTADIVFDPITITSKELSYDEDAIDEYMETALAAKQAEYDAAKQAADDPAAFPSFEEWLAQEEDMTLNEFLASLEAAAYDEVKPKATRAYIVREVAGDAGGVTYDKATYRVEITATLDGETLVPEVKMWKIGPADEGDAQVDEMAFANAYDATGTASLSGTKSIDGRSFTDGDSATFKIEATGDNAAEAPMPEASEVTITPTSGTSAAWAFEDIAYGLGDIPAGEESATFTYKVTESAFSMEGVAEGDDTAYEVTVTISDNGDGTLKVETSDNADALDFTNPYEEVVPPTPEPVSVTLRATKTFDGAAPGDREFTFTLTGTSDNAKDTSLEATNDTEGNVEFAAIEYEDEGVFEYEIAEKAGGDEAVEYDDSVCKVTVTVTKNDDNALEATVAYDGSETPPAFANTTKEEPPAPETVSISVTKVWDDGDDADGIRPDEVTIHLLANGEDTGETLTLTAADNWTGTFAGLPKAGEDGTEISYTVSEDAVEGYDEPVVSGDAETGFTVTNPHEPGTPTPPPDEPDNPTPPPSDDGTKDTPSDQPGGQGTSGKSVLAKTGDEAGLAALALALAASAALGAAFVVRRRRDGE